MSETIYDGPPSPAELERALVEVAKQRDQLLEGIEAASHDVNCCAWPMDRGKSNAHGVSEADLCDCPLKQLRVLAQHVRGGDACASRTEESVRQSTVATRGGSDQVDGVAPEATSDAAPKDMEGFAAHVLRDRFPEPVSEDQKLRELLDWLEGRTNEEREVCPAQGYSADESEEAAIVAKTFERVIAQIRSLLSSDAEAQGVEG